MRLHKGGPMLIKSTSLKNYLSIFSPPKANVSKRLIYCLIKHPVAQNWDSACSSRDKHPSANSCMLDLGEYLQQKAQV